MNIVVFGHTGFIGGKVMSELSAAGHIVIPGIDETTGQRADLTDKAAIQAFLTKTAPQVVINCAGVVDNSELAQANVTYTSNILKAITDSGVQVDRVLISGSAAEYGTVSKDDIPVTEEAPTEPSSAYGKSKLAETRLALAYGKSHQLKVTVARIFNPIGIGMKSKFIIPRIAGQLVEIENGERDSIEISRLDANRDYIDVRDVAIAIRLLVEGNPKCDVYNIGSGKATSNAELIHMVIEATGLKNMPLIVQTSPLPEPIVAEQADISRLAEEFNWQPQHKLDDTIKEIFHA